METAIEEERSKTKIKVRGYFDFAVDHYKANLCTEYTSVHTLTAGLQIDNFFQCVFHSETIWISNRILLTYVL